MIRTSLHPHLIVPYSEHTTAVLPCWRGLATSSECSVTQCVTMLNLKLSFRNATLRHESGILRVVNGLSGWAKAVGGEPRLPERTSAARLSLDPRWPPPKATCMLASAPPPAPVAFNVTVTNGWRAIRRRLHDAAAAEQRRDVYNGRSRAVVS